MVGQEVLFSNYTEYYCTAIISSRRKGAQPAYLPYLQALAEMSVRTRASKLPFKFDISEAWLHGTGLGARQGASTQNWDWVRPPHMEGSVVWLSENPLKSRRFSFTPRCLGKGAYIVL